MRLKPFVGVAPDEGDGNAEDWIPTWVHRKALADELADLMAKYSIDQARDPSGRFSSGSGDPIDSIRSDAHGQAEAVRQNPTGANLRALARAHDEAAHYYVERDTRATNSHVWAAHAAREAAFHVETKSEPFIRDSAVEHALSSHERAMSRSLGKAYNPDQPRDSHGRFGSGGGGDGHADVLRGAGGMVAWVPGHGASHVNDPNSKDPRDIPAKVDTMLPKGWTTVGITQRTDPNERSAAIFARGLSDADAHTMDNPRVWTVRDGDGHLATIHEGSGWTPDDPAVHDMLNTMSRYGPPYEKLDIGSPTIMTEAAIAGKEPSAICGMTDGAHPDTVMIGAQSAVEKWAAAEPNWHMPEAQSSTFGEYTVLHELGHVAFAMEDPAVAMNNFDKVTSLVGAVAGGDVSDIDGHAISVALQNEGLSAYGSSSPYEAIAEAHAGYLLGNRTPIVTGILQSAGIQFENVPEKS